jgi:hypothetical protein
MARRDRWTTVMASMGGAVVATALTSYLGRTPPAQAAPVSVVQATRFELVDGNGTVRAVIEMNGKGSPFDDAVFSIKGADGGRQVELDGREGLKVYGAHTVHVGHVPFSAVSGLFLQTPGTQGPDIALAVYDVIGGSPSLHLIPAGGSGRVDLEVAARGNPSFRMQDVNGKPSFKAP